MNIIKKIQKQVYPSKDYIFHEIQIDGNKINFFYNEVLSDSKSINEFILYRLTKLKTKELKSLNNHLPNCNTKVIKEKDILSFLNNGFLILIYDKIYACELRANLDRGINMIQSELALYGPKDSFTETYNTNLGLIRRRIKTSSLKCIDKVIGTYSKTKIGIIYIDGIVKKDLVEHVKEKLNKIKIDGTIDSSYLRFSLEKNFYLFPTIMMSERPDKCCMALLEGKIVILVDTSPYVLILPSFFLDFFHTTDDYYQKASYTSFIRIIRFLAFLISIITPALYLSVTTRHYSLIPLDLLLVLKAGRTFVPFPAYIEALFMILCFEILKESDFRMSSTNGSAISILGGLILGDAAVAAGIVSPIMIIVIAISSIAGLIFPTIEINNALRSYKILLLVLSTFLGIYGVIIGIIFLIFNICTMKTFGYKYLSIDKNEIKDSIIKINTKVKKRNSKLTNNIIRGKYQ